MIIQDFNYAIRLLSKKPGFTALTTLVMAVGIGLSVYLFSFFNTILYKDLAFENGESLVLFSVSRQGDQNAEEVNLHDYFELRNNLKGVAEFGSYRNIDVNFSGRDGARRYKAVTAESNIFQLTRTKPLLGRGFTAEEDKLGAEKVVVIGYDIWHNQFGGKDDVIDQTMRLNGENHRVLGVMPQGYFFPAVAQLWLPLRQDASQLTRNSSMGIHGLAHLDAETTMEEVQGQLNLIMSRLEAKFPETNNGIGAYVTTIPFSGGAGGEPVIYTLHIVAVLILILASINVGNLLLSRAVERSKETAIRVALGAPRSRIISQMLWESIIICTLGGIIGFLVMAWGLEISEGIVATFFADPPAFWWKFGIDAYTIKLFIAIVLGTIIVTGLIPAWKNSGADFNAVLRDGTRGALGKKSGRLNRYLVISEIFISMTVLIAAAVMVLAGYNQSNQDIGADIADKLVARVQLSKSTYSTELEQIKFAQTLQSRLENSTGIGNVMIATAVPGGYTLESHVAVEGTEYTKETKNSYPRANHISIMPGALKKLGVELKHGRYFDHSDNGTDKSTVLVSENFVKRNFKKDSPIGKRLRFTESSGEQHEWLTIVGVVENTIHGDRERKGFPSIYRPYTQAPRHQLTIAMQMKSSQAIATQTLRKILQSIDPELPSFRIETYEKNNERFTAPIRFISSLISLFGLAAVVLAASGIYGVMSNTINQRTQEIGIKRALGANDQVITKEFLMTGFKQLLWGAIPGGLAGCAMGFAMSQMFGTGNSALVIIVISITTIIASVVMLATYLPTKRALRLEPSQALHYE